jgi:hypothetical protein
MHGSVPEASYAGTLNYSAPELIPDSGHRSVRTDKADVYAFGCLVYSVFSRRQPFHEQLAHFGTSTSKRLGPDVLARVGPLLRGDGGRTPLRPNLADLEAEFTPEGLQGLLSRCWLTDHRRRPSIAEVLVVLENFPLAGVCLPGANVAVSTGHLSVMGGSGQPPAAAATITSAVGESLPGVHVPVPTVLPLAAKAKSWAAFWGTPVAPVPEARREVQLAAAAALAEGGAFVHIPMKAPLPEGWCMASDEKDVWYVGPEGQTQWERPTNTAFVPNPLGACLPERRLKASDPLEMPLPVGWCMASDETDVWYVGPEGQVQLERPT